MSALAALAYADIRSVVNAFRDIRRNAARSTLWIAGLLLFLLWLTLRASQAGRLQRPGFGALVQCDLIASIALVTFGIFLAHGSRFAGLFATRAEGQWIVRAPVSPFVATIYLHVRELLRRSPRLAITFGYLAVVYLPNVVSAAALVRDLLFFALALPAIGAVSLPRRLARGPLAAACTAAGYACIAFAAIALAHDAALSARLSGPLAAPALALPAWHPGSVLLEPFGAHSAAVLAALAAIALTAIVALGAAAADAYPELYAFSVEQIDRSTRVGRGLFAPRARTLRAPRATTSHRVPPGVAAFVWKAWIEFGRRTSPRAAVLQAAGWFGGGYLLALAIGPGRTALWFSLATVAFTLSLAASVGFGVSLGHELRRPLFWLAGAGLFARLCGLLAGSTLRYAAWIVSAGLGLIAGHGARIAVALLLLAAPALLVLLGAIGYAVYAAIPNEIDRRGPFALFRILVSYVLVVPMVVAGVVVSFAAHAAIVGIAVAAGAAIVETGGLLAFAATRLSGAALPRT